MKNKKSPVYLPLTHALAWIIGSTLFISGGTFTALKYFLKTKHQNRIDPKLALRTIIQTGPQKEALKTEYFAELLGISSDRPINVACFNLAQAKEKLLNSPLISHADIKLIKPATLYIDYTIRQPIAWLEDYENIAIDKEGYPFPFSPFFSPKNLPSIYVGLAPFGIAALDLEKPAVRWGTAYSGKYLDLALSVLSVVTDPKVADFFFVKRIDVSNAFAESYGTKEIIVITEDFIIKSIQGKEVQLCFPRILRLSTKHYAQELGNYLKLREQLLEEEQKVSSLPEFAGSSFRFKEKIIDFRIPKLAFIDKQ